MKQIKSFLLIAMLMAATTVMAQYTQDNPNVEYMFKVEVGYLHNVGNYGSPETPAPSNNTNLKEVGYRFNAYEEGMGLNIINGVNISQDFFLGGGVGYSFCAPMRPAHFDKSSHMAQVFVDMDFRPVGDIWAPMVGARIGGSFLMNPNNYGNTLSPYAEVYAGLNWFYDHALQQMNRNYHSLFAEVGIVLEQQSVFIPIRVGWRW
ncbi:MAG: hypothetical protein MJZ77_06425 [Bacteroidales bacterium]|nr:hypothetical protein [Bacteroidales bacterium]